jgi:hypothetical protein
LKRVATIRDPYIIAGIGQWGAIQSVAPSFGEELTPINLDNVAEMERAISAVFCLRRKNPPNQLILAVQGINSIRAILPD